MKKRVLGVLVGVVAIFTTFMVGRTNGLNSYKPLVCENQKMSIDYSAREHYLVQQGEEWQIAYNRMHHQWLQCTRDLTRAEEELNGDIICSEGVCVDLHPDE